MVKRSPTLGTLVSTTTKCIKLIFIGKITLVPVAFLMALSIEQTNPARTHLEINVRMGLGEVDQSPLNSDNVLI